MHPVEGRLFQAFSTSSCTRAAHTNGLLDVDFSKIREKVSFPYFRENLREKLFLLYFLSHLLCVVRIGLLNFSHTLMAFFSKKALTQSPLV